MGPDDYPPFHTDWSEYVLGIALWLLIIGGLVKFIMWIF